MKPRTFTAMLLALFVPGAGHLYLRRFGRAAIFFAIIVFLFISGLGLEGRLYTMDDGGLAALAALGSMGTGLLYFIARAAGQLPLFGYSVAGNYASMTFEYGTAFALTAGLMNLLLLVDVYDIAEGRKP